MPSPFSSGQISTMLAAGFHCELRLDVDAADLASAGVRASTGAWNRARLQRYENAMALDTFPLAPTPISADLDGRVLDGHHRTAAIARGGTLARSVVLTFEPMLTLPVYQRVCQLIAAEFSTLSSASSNIDMTTGVLTLIGDGTDDALWVWPPSPFTRQRWHDLIMGVGIL